METGKMINQISNRLRRRSRQVQEAIGISGAQGNILDYILVESRQRSVYQKEIEKEFGLGPSTATEALKLLEEKGLICRIPEEKELFLGIAGRMLRNLDEREDRHGKTGI